MAENLFGSGLSRLWNSKKINYPIFRLRVSGMMFLIVILRSEGQEIVDCCNGNYSKSETDPLIFAPPVIRWKP